MRSASHRERVALIGPARDFGERRFDGFALRHALLASWLANSHELSVVVLRRPGDDTPVHQRWGHLLTSDLSIPVDRTARGERLARAASDVRRLRPHQTWERKLVEIVGESGARCAITLGPWLGREYRAVHEMLPALHLFEEDLTRMREIAPQSWRSRALRRFEGYAWARRNPGPTIVGAMTEAEMVPARRLYPDARPVLLPFVLPSDEWPVAKTPSAGDVALVVGVLSEERNAEGVVAVIRELDRHPVPGLELHLASDAGLHPMLTGLPRPWVFHVDGSDLYPLYRNARVALVPSMRVTGTKTTVLQAWAAGCAVVSSAAAARSVGSRGVLSGKNAAELVDQLRRAWSSRELRAELVAEGRRQIQTRFNEQAQREAVDAIVRELCEQDGGVAARA